MLAHLKRLKAMSEAACPPPWECFEQMPCCGVSTPDCTVIHTHCSTGEIGPHTKANFNLIVTLRNSAPEIIDTLIQLMEKQDARH